MFLLLVSTISASCMPPARPEKAAPPRDADGRDDVPERSSPPKAARSEVWHPPAECADGDLEESPAGSCRLKPPPGPTCESFSDTSDACAKVASAFTPTAAKRIVGCLRAKSGTKAICAHDVGETCMLESLRDGCIDRGAYVEAACRRAIRECERVAPEDRKVTLEACQALMSAVKPDRRAFVRHCLEVTCSPEPCYLGVIHEYVWGDG